jgi:hypothetical protein
MLVMAILVACRRRVISAIGIVNPEPRRQICAECPGGALAGATQDAGRAAGLRDRPSRGVKVPQRAAEA